jgi:hypothetical protein
MAPATRDRLHWVRREETGELLVWNWTAASGIWHATPYTVFFTAEQAFAAGYRYHAVATPPRVKAGGSAPGPQGVLPIPFTLA